MVRSRRLSPPALYEMNKRFTIGEDQVTVKPAIIVEFDNIKRSKSLSLERWLTRQLSSHGLGYSNVVYGGRATISIKYEDKLEEVTELMTEFYSICDIISTMTPIQCRVYFQMLQGKHSIVL